MRLFQRSRVTRTKELVSNETFNLLWRYEVSEDGGKNWHPESEGDAKRPDILRRGNWVSPPAL